MKVPVLRWPRIRYKDLLCFLSSTLLTLPSVAEASSQLEQLYDAALAHPSVALARSNQQVAGYDLETARWGRYPSLSLNAARPFQSIDSSMTISVEQPLYTAGRIGSVIGSAEARLEASVAGVLEASDQIKLEVAGAYIDMLSAQRRLLEAEENIRALERLGEVIERRVKQQVSARAEQTLVTARLQQAISDRHQYIGLLNSASNRLESATAQRVKAVNALRCSSNDSAIESALVEAALNRSPVLTRIEREREAALHDVDTAEAERYPRLVLGVENSSEAGSLYNSEFKTYIGLQFQLQDGLSINSRTESARAKLSSIHENQRLAQVQIRTQVSALLRDYQAASNQIPPLESLVESNQNLIDSYLRQYQVGKKSWLDVLNAQREVFQARFLLGDALALQCSSAVRMELITGQKFVLEAP